jgi:hypothetical protein
VVVVGSEWQEVLDEQAGEGGGWDEIVDLFVSQNMAFEVYPVL